MIIKQNLAQLSKQLAQAGLENAGLEAELLVAQVLQKNREFILAYPELALNSAQRRQLARLVKRRLALEPMAYITGRQHFYNIDLAVSKKVLIPRPETELLVELILKQNPSADTTIVELGTGSGAISIALAKNLAGGQQLIATDISSKALALAKDNAKTNGQADKIEFIKSDLLQKLLRKKHWTTNKQLIIVANLPYLSADWQKELTAAQITELKYEPALALFAGEDGFDIYRRLAEEAKSLVKKFDFKIQLYCEIAPGQANLFSHSFAELGKVSLERDLNGRVRVGIVN